MLLTYVALLRGINVGGNNRVEMSKLKKMFESLGYTEVLTYINSGNVIFRSSETETEKMIMKLETEFEMVFGFGIRIVIRDGENLKLVVKKIPESWTNDTRMKTDLLFLWPDYSEKSTVDLINQTPDVDNLKYIEDTIVWMVERKNYNKSGMRKFIGTKVYKNMTARNVNTVRKLASLMK